MSKTPPRNGALGRRHVAGLTRRKSLQTLDVIKDRTNKIGKQVSSADANARDALSAALGVVKALKRINAPKVLQQLVTLVFLCPGLDCCRQDLDQIEFFGGKREVTRVAWRRGRLAVP